MVAAKSTDSSKAADKPVTAEDQEWMDGASSSFPKAEHLGPTVPPNFGPGRLVAIWVKGHGERKNDEGTTYPYVETLTLVLDEGPDANSWLTGTNGWGEEASSLVGPAPVRLEDFQWSPTGFVARLMPRLKGKSAAGVPLRFRPYVGRVNTQASSRNKNVAAFSISAPTDSDMAIARKYRETIVEINKEMEAAETAAQDQEAFTS